MEELIRKYALQNAIQFKGKANPGAVVGKVLGENPDLKKEMGALGKTIAQLVADVNKLSLDDQKKELESLAPELLQKKERKEHDLFGSVQLPKRALITCTPPEPSKYPHIGHAKAILINNELANRKEGKFILRLEDTNPTLAKQEFYDIIESDVKWLGVEPAEITIASDYMETFYACAKKLIESGNAYMNTTPPEEMKDHRFKKTECADRNRSVDENLKLFDKFFTAEEGSMVLCLKGDMQNDNSVMRDPTLMRIIDHEHPKTGTKHRVWPTFDFENAIMDGEQQVSLRFRTKEFELRTPVQQHIQKLLGYEPTEILAIARFNMQGIESSGRVIREKIEKGELIGWDDPSLTTLTALRRRGFTPDAINSFCLSTGISKSEATYTWDDLIKHNRRVLDESANRYFFVQDPIEVTINDSPSQKIELKLNPNNDQEKRIIEHQDTFYLAKEDVASLNDGELYRLMDCLNFKKTDATYTFDSTEIEPYKQNGKKIMHWLPQSDDLIDVEVLMPDKTTLTGKAEANITDLNEGDVIQFERFGFCRLDKKENNTYTFWFTHK